MLRGVHEVKELAWPFGESPRFHIAYGTTTLPFKADPFPCYPHDAATVRQLAERVERIFPIGRDVNIYVPEFEAAERTNGCCAVGYIWNGQDKPRGWNASIVLSGKRIPIHPAMTRYLVAHEYGHAAERWIEELHGMEDGAMRAEYTKLRGAGTAKEYGGRTWHASIGEVFANDFRILLCETEEEFWPHPDFPRPETQPHVRKWWEQVWGENLKRQ